MRVLALTVILTLAVAAPSVASDSVSYFYDLRGQLQSVTYANGTTITYVYDVAGNRLSQTVSCPGQSC